MRPKTAFFILSGLLVALTLFVFRDFVLLKNVFLYKDIGSDSINGWYPDLYHISDYIHEFGLFPKWSFYAGMGQNISGLIFGDPFSLALYLAGSDHIATLVGFIEAAKLITAGLFFYLFVRQLNITSYAAIVGAMCFAFCGFIVLGTCWYQHSTEACLTAFLLFAVEKLLHKKWVYFPFAIAVIGVTLPFDLFLFTLLIAVYVFVRLYDQFGFSRKIWNVYGQLFILGLLGIGMGAIFVLPKLQMMLDSPRVSGDVSFFSALMSTPVFQLDGLIENLTKTGRLFSNDLLGTGNDFIGTVNYLEAPLFYMGLVGLLLFPQLFPFLSKKKKWLLGIVLFVALLPFVFPFLRYALWLFAGKYYRILSFFFALLLLMYATLALHHIILARKINYKILAGTLLLLIVLLFIPNIFGISNPYEAGLPLYRRDIQWCCLVFLLLYTVVLSFVPRKNMMPALIVLLFVELAFLANTTVNQRDIVATKEMRSKEGYNDYTIEAVNIIHRTDSSFYRIHKTYDSSLSMHKSLKDPMVQKYYGTTSYLQFNQSSYVRFLLATHVISPDLEGDDKEWATRWIEGLNVDRPFLQIFGNVHYVLTKHPTPELTIFNDSITRIGDVHIYKNKYRLPFGYTFSRYMPRSIFDKLPNKDIALLEAVVIDDKKAEKYAGNLFKLVQPVATEWYSFETLSTDVSDLSQESFQLSHFDQNNIKGEITLSGNKLLFFTIPYDKGWKAFDNGKPVAVEQVNIGFSGILLSSGSHRIELRFEPAGYYLSIFVSLFSLLTVFCLILLNRYFPNRAEIVMHG